MGTENGLDTKTEEEYALLTTVCAGDSRALEQLLAKYEPLIRSAVTSLMASCPTAVEFEVRSEASYAFYRAALSFDRSQTHLTFGLYAKICMRNHLISRFLRPKAARDPLSLDDLYRSGDVQELFPGALSEMPGDRLTEDESIRMLYQKIREILSPFELSVFHLWSEGYSASEIALHLERTEKSVSNALARSLAKLRRTL